MRSISELLNDSTLSAAEKEYLVNEKKYTLERKNVFEKTVVLLTQPSKPDTTKKIIINKHNRPVEVQKQNRTAVFITVNLLIILIMVLLPIFLIIDLAIGETNIIEALIALTFVEGFFYVIAKSITESAMKLPSLFNQPIINYIAYALINILVVSLLLIPVFRSEDLRRDLIATANERFEKRKKRQS